jgi:hypothetical protein
MKIEGLELLSVVKLLTHGIVQRGVLVQEFQMQGIGPPIGVPSACTV